MNYNYFKSDCFKQNNQYYGSKIKTLRTRFHLTQEDLALILRVNKNTVALWERGIRKPTNTGLTLLNILATKGFTPFIW